MCFWVRGGHDDLYRFCRIAIFSLGGVDDDHISDLGHQIIIGCGPGMIVDLNIRHGGTQVHTLIDVQVCYKITLGTKKDRRNVKRTVEPSKQREITKDALGGKGT